MTPEPENRLARVAKAQAGIFLKDFQKDFGGIPDHDCGTAQGDGCTVCLLAMDDRALLERPLSQGENYILAHD